MLAAGAHVDRFELVCPIGEGGMAEVWVARQHGKHGFAKLFALKAIHPRFADDPQFRHMFLDEARIASAIEHPNVAQVFDLGESGSMLYLVMEYVDGESLASILNGLSDKTGAPARMPVAVALRVIADVCAGLHAAHRLKDGGGELRGVVHRDVSPHNVLLSVKGDVKVIDFGIALASGRLGADTGVSGLKGKLHYMAPEQVRREPVGPYTDVFAAGATLYRLLAGQAPYEADNDAQTVGMLLNRVAAPALPGGVPPLVAAIVARAMSVDPGDRYPTALEMQTAIEAALVGESLPDLARWVQENLSERYRIRDQQIASRAALSVSLPQAAVGPTMQSAQAAYALTDRPGKLARPASVPDLVVPPAPARPVMTAEPLEVVETEAVARRASPPRPPQPEIRSFAAALSEPEDARERSFIDIGALAAQRAAEAAEAAQTAEAAGKEDRAAEKGDAKAPAEASKKPRAVVAIKKPAPTLASRSATWTRLAIGVAVALAVLLVVMLFLPMIARERIVSTARSAGIELGVEGVGVGLAGVTLRGVTATIPGIPGFRVHADEVFAGGTSADTVRVSNVDLKLDGTIHDLGASLGAFYARNRAQVSGTSKDPRRISLVGVRVRWDGLFGEGSRLDAGTLGAELDSRGPNAEELRASVERFELTTPKTVLGPWSGSFEQTPKSSRARLAFDPPVPDGPSAVLVWGPATASRLTLRIPRSPFAQLGIRPADLGLPADAATELEAKIEWGATPTGRLEGQAHVELSGARVPGWRQPVDVKVDGGLGGVPGKALDLEKTIVIVGPFTAGVTGTITPLDLGFRFDGAWKTVPITCEKIAKAEAKNLGAFAATVQEIGQKTGALRVTGTALAAGTARYDTRTPDEPALTFTTKEACGLSFFGL